LAISFVNRTGGMSEISSFLPFLVSMSNKYKLFNEQDCVSWAKCALPCSIGNKDLETRLQAIWKMSVIPARVDFFLHLVQLFMLPSMALTFNSLFGVFCEKQEISALIGRFQSKASQSVLGMLYK